MLSHAPLMLGARSFNKAALPWTAFIPWQCLPWVDTSLARPAEAFLYTGTREPAQSSGRVRLLHSSASCSNTSFATVNPFKAAGNPAYTAICMMVSTTSARVTPTLIAPWICTLS